MGQKWGAAVPWLPVLIWTVITNPNPNPNPKSNHNKNPTLTVALTRF